MLASMRDDSELEPTHTVTSLTSVMLLKTVDHGTLLVPCIGVGLSPHASSAIRITLLAEFLEHHEVEPEIRDRIEIEGERYMLAEVTKHRAGYVCVGSHAPAIALSRARTTRM
jgi:hypothetical protein